MKLKNYLEIDVLQAAQERIAFVFDNFENIALSFSGGKDSSVMFHLVMDEAKKRNRKITVLLIDFEAQYKLTESHVIEMLDLYRNNIIPHWVCLPIKLRNASSSFEPVWTCWDKDNKDLWVRDYPNHASVIKDESFFPFFQPKMEFEEFVPLYAEWLADGKPLAQFVGIRCDESLNRFRTIAVYDKGMFQEKRWTTQVTNCAYNVYPIYDWRTEDIWRYHSINPSKPFNQIYELMHKAGVKLSQQRLCQPYGDDQRRGLWLYHILEPETWVKVVARVNGANSGALYIQERGNVNGFNKITLPPNHTYKSFCNLLLSTMPEVTRNHFIPRFRVFMKGWRGRGYVDGIPDFAPKVLEDAHWAPSWRRLCKVLLRNDWWCKGLGMTQPKSEAYSKYLAIKQSKTKQKQESLL